MVKSDLSYCESELNEVLYLFEGGSELNVRHLFREQENKVVNTVVVGGKSYAYGNLIRYKDETDKKRLVKRYAKLSVYKALSAYTGQNLPWGSLTGVRPTKLAYQQLESGEDFKDFFINTLKVSEQKTALIEKVIKNQEGVYDKKVTATDFYVSVPFCPTRCKYCSFINADIRSARKYLDEYVDALVMEIEESSKFVKNLRSIYVGGGTPVSLDNEKLEKILSAIDKINNGVEYTVEAGRPDSITRENLAILKGHNVTRICINPQTFNDKTLQRIGRLHTANDIIEKYELAKKDFSINMDLIAGLDGETFEDFKYSIDKAISLSPDNITVHTLAVKKGSYLAEETKLLPAGEVGKMVEYAHETLFNNGYSPYYLYRQKYMAGCLENTGYAKEGKRCLYNIDVMEEISRNVACGAGSISKEVKNNGEEITRLPNPKDIKTYLDKINLILKEKMQFFG